MLTRDRLRPTRERDPIPQWTWSDDFMALADELDAPVAQLEVHIDQILEEVLGLGVGHRDDAMESLATRVAAKGLLDSHYDPERARRLLDDILADAGQQDRDMLQSTRAALVAEAEGGAAVADEEAPAREREVEVGAERREIEADTAGSDVDLKRRLEGARAEMGKVREKLCTQPPPGFDPQHKATFIKTYEARVAAGKAPNMWCAADDYSFECLRRYTQQVGLGSYDALVAKGEGVQWCGAFVGDHYQLGAAFERISDGDSATVAVNNYLASDIKAKELFQYRGRWANARIEDPDAPPEASVEERFKPLRAWHAGHGGEREWHAFKDWGDDPAAVAKPGMMLFIEMEDRPGRDHLVFVDRVARDARGRWVVHTLEGNGKGAKTMAGEYVIGQRTIHGVARPAPLDFDPNVKMVDDRTYARLLAQEQAQAARAKSAQTARSL